MGATWMLNNADAQARSVAIVQMMLGRCHVNVMSITVLVLVQYPIT